jgi:predicted transposase/invertase (TIGR01784 family)
LKQYDEQNENNLTKDKTKFNLKNDIIFKAFFSRKGNEEFLIDFLEALLNIKIKEIKVKEEVNIEQLSVEEKGGRLDLQAKLNDGIIVNIELQMKNHFNIEERTTFYSSKVISRETKRGSNYNDISKVIMINILGYNLLEFEEYISETMIVPEKHRDYEMLDGIKWYFIELPKFRKQNPDMNEKINQWLSFIDDWNMEAVKMAESKNDTLRKARKEMEYLTGDAAIRRMAELREKWEMDYESGIDCAEKRGIRKGIENEKIEIAKKLIEKGMTISEIIEITGLSEEIIEKLTNQEK